MSNIQFGEILGIEEGQKFSSRKDLVVTGLHRSIQHGIDGNGFKVLEVKQYHRI